VFFFFLLVPRPFSFPIAIPIAITTHRPFVHFLVCIRIQDVVVLVNVIIVNINVDFYFDFDIEFRFTVRQWCGGQYGLKDQFILIFIFAVTVTIAFTLTLTVTSTCTFTVAVGPTLAFTCAVTFPSAVVCAFTCTLTVAFASTISRGFRCVARDERPVARIPRVPITIKIAHTDTGVGGCITVPIAIPHAVQVEVVASLPGQHPFASFSFFFQIRMSCDTRVRFPWQTEGTWCL
jgi:hypothetical protein